jgi:iron complex transport system ATP-binding protein
MILKAERISVELGGRRIVDDVSFELDAGEKLMIIGPNGAGKTTLIRAVTHAVPHEGKAEVSGADVASFKPGELARRIGVLTQTHSPQFSYTAREVVSLGRYAYRKGLFAGESKDDKERIERAMALTGTGGFAHASIQTLSGGELQRVFLAQLFAQDPDVLILDEPTNNLDLSYQIAVFDLVDEWVRGGGKAAIAVIHDLNMVYRYATKAMLMVDGKRRAYGSAEEVLSAGNLNDAYGVDIAGWMKGLLKHWERTDWEGNAPAEHGEPC